VPTLLRLDDFGVESVVSFLQAVEQDFGVCVANRTRTGARGLAGERYLCLYEVRAFPPEGVVPYVERSKTALYAQKGKPYRTALWKAIAFPSILISSSSLPR
jgi:hypothetical protein